MKPGRQPRLTTDHGPINSTTITRPLGDILSTGVPGDNIHGFPEHATTLNALGMADPNVRELCHFNHWHHFLNILLPDASCHANTARGYWYLPTSAVSN